MQNQQSQPSLFNINDFHETSLNVCENFCAVFCRPLELILRPRHGTQYFQLPVIFFASALMLLMPLFSAVTSGLFSLVPFMRVPPPMGLFGIGSLSKLYFLLSAVHGVRLYRRMLNMASESHSEFEGPPLPFFYALPKGNSFWFTRIVLEPAFVFISAKVLESFFIFQSGLTTYCEFTAVCLCMKGYIGWYRDWRYIRKLMDMKFAGPIIAKLVDNSASDEELASIHMASFPKNLEPELREAAVAHIARAYEQ